MGKKLKLPFKKGSHVKVIELIAKGMHEMGELETYVELGVQRGAAFNTAAPYATKVSYAIDISEVSHSHIKGNKNAKWFCGKTEDFISQYNGPPIDFVFIDADHTYEASLQDFLGISEFVREGGIIAMHDTYPMSEEFTEQSYCGEAYKTAEYIRKNLGDEFEIVTLPFYFGVSIIRKTKKQLVWKK